MSSSAESYSLFSELTPTSSISSFWALIWALISSWAYLIASVISSSEISLNSPSTITTESSLAPTIISISDSSSWAFDGFIKKFPSILATLTSEIGPSNGISDNDSAAEAARPTNASGITFSSWDINCIITWVSL